MSDVHRKASDLDHRRVVRRMRDMSEAEKAWVAGIVEGEGCLRYYDSTQGRALTCTASVVVVMTDEDVILDLQKVTGLGNVGENSLKDGPGLRQKQPYRWAVTDRQGVLDLLHAIRPYLRSRRGAKADVLLDGIKKDMTWMQSREQIFANCGHEKNDENVGYRYDRRRNLDVPYCKECQKVGRPPSKTGQKRRQYDWDLWMNGETWIVQEDVDYAGDPVTFRTTLWGKARRVGKKVVYRIRGTEVRFRFMDPEDWTPGAVTLLDDPRVCLAVNCDKVVRRKSSLAKFCSDECYFADKDFNYRNGYAANPKRGDN